MVCAIQEVLMVCYPYAQLTAVYTSLTHYFVLASRAPSITITLNALPITMVATEKPRSPGSPPPTILQQNSLARHWARTGAHWH